MKKISIILILALLGTYSHTVFAETTENLVLTVKNRIEVPDGYTEFQNIDKSETDGKTYYNFGWRNPEDQYQYVTVIADENGNVRDYSFSDEPYSYDNRYEFIKIDMSAAEKTALDFIAKVNPEISDNVSLSRSKYNYRDEVRFDITGIFNGIEYKEILGRISVDSDMNITSMSINIPDIEDAQISCITQEEAYRLYMEKIGVETKYYTYTAPEEALKIIAVSDFSDKMSFPVYQDISNKAIDAQTGEVVDISTEYLYRNESTSDMVAGAEKGAGGLTDEEIKKIEELNNIISESEALNIIKERTGVEINAKNMSVYYSGEYCYYFSEYDDENYKSTCVNAENGDIMSLNFSNAEDVFADYNLNDNADEIIKTLAPTYGAMYNVSEITDDSINYEYKVNGITINGIDAHFSKSNKYVSFSIDSLRSCKDIEYADPKNFIPVSEQFSEPSLVELRYADTKDGIKAVYMVVDSFFVNALTGKEVNYRNEEVKATELLPYKDTENHWVKTAAEQLMYANIGFEGGELNPDTELTAQEAYDIINTVYSIGEKPDEADKLTRIKAAELIIEAKDLTDISKLDIYKQPYSDTTENYGAVSILKGYGIIAGDTDTFRPYDNITRAEFLQMLYNTLLML